MLDSKAIRKAYHSLSKTGFIGMVQMPYSLRKYTSPHILQACGVVPYSKPTKSSDNEVMRSFTRVDFEQKFRRARRKGARAATV